MSLEPGKNFGSYEIVKLLGRGGMGEVYLARDSRLNRNVAIKILSSDLLPSSQLIGRFRREAGLAAVLNHPNICTVYDTGETDGQIYICMEYVEGKTLRDRLRESPMHLPEILDVSIQIADALEEARRKNIVHRDIKTGNIVLTPRSQVKILDFGLAKQLRDVSSNELSQELTDSRLTHTGEVRGTVAYMSPEQALGKQVDHRSDIFSFGVVLYEMLAGRLPFSGNSATEVVDSILHSDPLPVARFNDEAPDELIRILNKMLDKDPEMRYQSVHEVWVDLRRIQESQKKGEPLGKRHWWERQGLPFWSVAVIALMLIALGVYYVIRPSSPPAAEGKPDALTQGERKVTDVAVLPFGYQGSDPERKYLGAMVTDALIAGLQVVPGVSVAPYENVRDLKGDNTVSNIARHLGVGLVIKGTVATKEQESVITAEVFSADGEVLSRQTLSGRPVATIDLIRKNILGALNIDVSPAKQIDQVRTPNVQAYKKYLEARDYQEGWDVENNLEKAAALYKEALTSDPDFAAAHAGLSMTLISLFHKMHDPSFLSSASTSAKRALALDAGLPEALLAYGMVQLESGKSVEATDAFSRALDLAPGDDAACRSLGVMYSSLGRNKEAREMHQRAIDLRPDYWRNHYDMGRFEWQFAGDLQSARRHMEKANQIHPEGFAPLIGLGILHLTQGNLENAEIYFRKTLEKSPNLYAYNNLGLIYYYRGQYDLALRNWQALLKEAPDKPLNTANVADALRQLDRKDESNAFYRQAIEKFRSALKTNRADDKSRAGMAMALAATGQCKQATDEIRGVLERQPDSPELRDYSTIAISRCKDWDWAKQLALSAIASNNLLVVRFDPDVKRVREMPEVQAALEQQIIKESHFQKR